MSGRGLAQHEEEEDDDKDSDPYTANTLLFCPLEIKKPDGNFQEAQLQISIWMASVLAHLDTLKLKNQSTQSLPLVFGWTVVGHQWCLHMAWREDDGSVNIAGPFPHLVVGTTCLTMVQTIHFFNTSLLTSLKKTSHGILSYTELDV